MHTPQLDLDADEVSRPSLLAPVIWNCQEIFVHEFPEPFLILPGGNHVCAREIDEMNNSG